MNAMNRLTPERTLTQRMEGEAPPEPIQVNTQKVKRGANYLIPSDLH